MISKTKGKDSIKEEQLIKVQEALGYSFKKPEHLEEALTHPSIKKEVPKNYQRLEFLGDSFLGFIVADYLYHKFPDEQEGFLAKRKTLYCSGTTQSQIAKDLDLLEALILSDSAKEQGLRDNPKIMEDVLESIIGAVYVDGGYLKAKQVVKNLFFKNDELINAQKVLHNPKGILQEHFQSFDEPVSLDYKVKKISGPDHSKKFHIELLVNGKRISQGDGQSKKKAEELAALQAIEILKLDV